jgi:uncharacterized protein YuzE
MDPLRILESAAEVDWEYGEEADVLYLSLGQPRPSLGIDVGDGVILRYDEAGKEVIGLTLIGLRARLLRALASTS